MSNTNETLLGYFQRMAREQPDVAEWSRGARIMQEFISLTQHDDPNEEVLRSIQEEVKQHSRSCGSGWTDMMIRIQNFSRSKEDRMGQEH